MLSSYKSMNTQSMKKRIVELDIIRVISLLLIVLFHTTYWFKNTLPSASEKYSYFMWGDLGVSFFIILSGCVLTLTNSKFCDHFSFRKDILTFYKKRIVAILPSFWVAYFITNIFLFVLLSDFFPNLDLGYFLFSLLGLDGFVSTMNVRPIYYRVGEWFTGFILALYLIAPFLIWILIRSSHSESLKRAEVVKKISFIAFIVLLSFISIYFSPLISKYFKFWSTNPFWNPTSRIAEFCLGIIFGNEISKSSSLIKSKTTFFFSLLIFFISTLFLDKYNNQDGFLVIIFYCSAFVVFYLFLIKIKNLVKKNVLF